MARKILITGGMGFIGSNLVRHWMKQYPDDSIVVLDAMTYAARPKWVYESKPWGRKCDAFERVDIADHAAVSRVFRKHKPTDVLHLAAESHVCRSISGPAAFVHTNFVGTFHLLEEFKELWGSDPAHRFLHVSTDEVFGQLGPEDRPFREDTPIDPRSPYACTKAGSDMLAKCYHTTYGVNTIVTNCSNNFGPNQHAEKLIPKTIQTCLLKQPMTIYGTGEQIRDWIWVGDHCKAIDLAFHQGKAGERYCVGGYKEMSNIDLVTEVWLNYNDIVHEDLALVIQHTDDRPTDDFRYAIDSVKLEELGYSPDTIGFEENLRQTIRWYLDRAPECFK